MRSRRELLNFFLPHHSDSEVEDTRDRSDAGITVTQWFYIDPPEEKKVKGQVAEAWVSLPNITAWCIEWVCGIGFELDLLD